MSKKNRGRSTFSKADLLKDKTISNRPRGLKADQNQQVYEFVRDNGPCTLDDVVAGLNNIYAMPHTHHEVGIRLRILTEKGFLIKTVGSWGDNTVWKVKEAHA